MVQSSLTIKVELFALSDRISATQWSLKMEAPTWLKKFSSSTKKKRARSPPIEGTTEAAETQPHQTQRSQGIQPEENGDDLEYMSEALLAVEEAKKSVPRFPLKKTANTKPKPLKEIMHVALEEGLVKPLDQSNLGFKMVRLISHLASSC